MQSKKSNPTGAVVLITSMVTMIMVVLISCQKPLSEINLTEISDDVYPGQQWQKISRPEQLGWSSSKLAEARRYARKIDSAAVMIIDNGVVIESWGDVSRDYKCHSMRKSLVSGLYGIFVANGTIDLSQSLAELNINDYPNHLSEIEKQATVGDLIKARSGIYIEALGESPDMKARRPKRHSHAPGTFWYYNNWDFNALGTIFEQETGQDLFEAFAQQLARPLHMQDFNPANCSYKDNSDYGTPGLTMHRYYDFRMSARDLARFGLLFLRDGRWQDHQVLSREWIQESTASHSRYGVNSGYGYMWWTGSQTGIIENVRLKDHSYSAAGWGGHRLIVLPWRNLIVVHRVDTDQPGKSVSSHQIGRLLWHILDAAGETEIGPKPTVESSVGTRLEKDQLGALLPGCSIHGPDFRIYLTPDYRFELFSEGKRIDTGEWGIRADRFWLKSRIVTGGQKAYLTMVLDGDRLKWYDRHGTRIGQGKIKREEK